MLSVDIVMICDVIEVCGMMSDRHFVRPAAASNARLSTDAGQARPSASWHYDAAHTLTPDQVIASL